MTHQFNQEEKKKEHLPTKDLYKSLHGNIIHSSLKLEIIQMSIK